MLQSLWLAMGLVFIIEGLLPFLAPGIWRRSMLQMTVQSDKAIRLFGLISMLIGLIVLYLVH